MDPEGNILAINPSFIDLCRMPEKKLLSMKIQEFNITGREGQSLADALNNIGIKVSEAVSLINKSVTDLASRTEEANASVEEVTAGAQQVAFNAGKVSKNAQQGGDGISQVIRAMEDLNETVTAVSRKLSRYLWLKQL